MLISISQYASVSFSSFDLVNIINADEPDDSMHIFTGHTGKSFFSLKSFDYEFEFFR